MELNLENLYFSEPRLVINRFSRFLARFVIYIFYAVLCAAAVIFFLSDIQTLFWLSLLFFLFLGDRALHFREAEHSITGLIRYLPRLKRRKIAQKPINLNAAFFLSPSGFSVMERAFDRALILGGDFYLYVLNSLAQAPEIRKALVRLDVNIEEFDQKIKEFLEREEIKKNKNLKKDLFLKAENLAKAAFIQAFDAKDRFIEPPNLFSALSAVNDSNINRIFSLFEIKPSDLEKATIFSRFGRLKPKVLGAFAHRPYRLRHRTMNRAWTARPTPTLDQFGTDFTDLARSGKAGFLISHETEYSRLIDVLSRPTNPNALLVGEPGVGKEAVVHALAFGLVKDEVPEAIFDKRLVALNIGDLISGASGTEKDEMAKRLNKIVEEIFTAGNVILYLPDIHNLTKTGGQGLSAADILLPVFQNDAFPVIGATYPREYKQFIETKSDFANIFETIRVEEISEEAAEKLLAYQSLILENKYKITISFGAVKQAVSLAHKHFRHKLLPSSAEDLLKEAISYISQKGNKLLQADDMIAVAERKINVPIHRPGKAEAEKLLNLESVIHQRLIDQEPAVSAVSRALREYRSGLGRKGGPIAGFLFVGPTGVGKTELSKILAEIHFGSENSMVRFDMSEYQTQESISRFIGSPDGRIAGSLTEAIIQKPYALILLDEFEKAHSDILNLFLQVFDDGRLTDSLGRTVDFTNTIIISTSNAHSNFIKESIEAGKPIERIGDELKKKLTEYFKPELLNRFSQIIVFKNLSPADIKEIAGLQLKSLAKTLAESHGVLLEFDETAVEYVAQLGYDPVFGARPLRGVISEKLRSPLAEKILKGEIAKGDNIKIALENNELKFRLTR